MNLNNRSPKKAIIDRNEHLLFQITKRATQGYFEEFRFNLNDYTKVFCINENSKKEHYLKKFEECKSQIQNYEVYPVEVVINDFAATLNFQKFRGYSILMDYSNDILLEDQIFYEHGDMKTGPELMKIYQNLRFDIFLVNILFPSIEFYYYKYLIIEIENKSLPLLISELPENKAVIINLEVSQEAAAKTDLPKKDVVKIDPEVLQEVYESLEGYFDDGDYLLLLELLEGKEITRQLVFKNDKTRLTELCKRIEYNDYFMFAPEKTVIARWICKNFTTQNGDFNHSNVLNKELSSTKFTLAAGKRICKTLLFLNQTDLKLRKLNNMK